MLHHFPSWVAARGIFPKRLHAPRPGGRPGASRAHAFPAPPEVAVTPGPAPWQRRKRNRLERSPVAGGASARPRALALGPWPPAPTTPGACFGRGAAGPVLLWNVFQRCGLAPPGHLPPPRRPPRPPRPPPTPAPTDGRGRARPLPGPLRSPPPPVGPLRPPPPPARSLSCALGPSRGAE